MRCATRKTYHKQVKLRDKQEKQIRPEKIADIFYNLIHVILV